MNSRNVRSLPDSDFERASPGTPRDFDNHAHFGRDCAFKLHALNRNSANLALLKYRDFQGFMITGQHSGTHWIKWMLSHAVAHHHGVAPPRFFDNPSSNDLIGHPKHPRLHPDLPRLASSHSIAPYALDWGWLRRLAPLPPYLLVVRDVRDVLVSNYEKWRHAYGVGFAEYLAGDPRGRRYVCDIWWYVRFLNRWGEVAWRYPDETLVLRYEDFQADALGALRRAAAHLGLALTEADLEAGVAMGAKDIMGARRDPAVDQRSLRPDGEGEARFSRADLELVGDILDRHLKHDFGYGYLDAPRGLQLPALAQGPREPPRARSSWRPMAGAPAMADS